MNNLRELRQLRHVSFEDVAKACHIHYSRLKSIEKGQKASTLEWAQMCIYFSVTPQELIPQDKSLWADVDALMKAILKERERTMETELRLSELQAQISKERHTQQREFDKAKEKELRVLLQRTESLRQQYDEEQSATFRKELDIPREYFNAATTILQGFIQSLRSQEGDNEILSASIRQQEAKLILIVRTKSGVKETVEKSFTKFGAVVLQKAPIESITKDPFLIFELKHQLELARLQLRTQQELAQIRDSNHEVRIQDLEKREAWMQQQIGLSMSSYSEEIREAIRMLGSKSEVSRLLAHLQETLKKPESKEESKSILRKAGDKVVTDGLAPGVASTVVKLIEKLNDLIGLA